MKKILALILVAALMLSLAACTKRPESGEEPAEPDKTMDVNPSAAPSEKPTPPIVSEQPADDPELSPSTEPAESSPATSSEPEEAPEPSEEPEESPSPSEKPSEKPQDKPEDNANSGKVDSDAVINSTATDLAPADSSFLSLIPELPFEGWASTNVDANSVLLELDAPADAQAKLMEYIQTLRDEGFDVTEYTYGSLYEASSDGVTVTIMLEGGKLSLIIEKK